jgi:polyhydroxyalkanoate synthesis regulator phasin
MAQSSPPSDPASLLELLTKGIVLTTDRIQATLDDAVRRGRMTRDDAEDLTRSLVESGRKQTEDLLHDLEALIGRSIDAAGDASRRAGERIVREGDRARRKLP